MGGPSKFNPEPYIGKRYQDRTVIAFTGHDAHGGLSFLCRCDEGHEKVVRFEKLRSGNASCRICSSRRIGRESAERLAHPARKTQAYKCWMNMRQRTAHDESYVRRGIAHDPRWDSFDLFLADMGNPTPPRIELDRIDGTKGYYKENCRWATHQENNANRTALRMLTYDGKTMCIAHWEKYLGVKLETLRKKLRANRPISVIM